MPVRQGTPLETLAGRHTCVKYYKFCYECIFIVVALMSDPTLGLNFRNLISVANCSDPIISSFFALPCCDPVTRVFQKFGCVVEFLMVTLFRSRLPPFPDHTLVCWHLNHGSSKSGLVCSFAGFRQFFHLHSFLRVSPLPTLPSQIIVPVACWQGSRQCDFRCVL